MIELPLKGPEKKEFIMDEKVVIPSNEEVLEVTECGDEIDVTDVGNKESAKILDENPAFNK